VSTPPRPAQPRVVFPRAPVMLALGS